MRREEIAEEPLGRLAGRRGITPPWAVIRPRCVEQLRGRSDRTGLLVGCAEDDQSDPREDRRGRAHRTWLDGDVEGAIQEAPAPEDTGSLAHREDLGVSGRIAVDLTPVVRSRDHGALADDRGTDGDVVVNACSRRLIESLSHEVRVVRWTGDPLREGRTGVWTLLHIPRYLVSISRAAASSAAAPLKTIAPLFITYIRSPTADASARFCSTSRMVSPPARRCASATPTSSTSFSATPACATRCAATPVTSTPPIRMTPRRGRRKPAIADNVVVLPAPLRPTSETAWPASIVRSTPCST